MQLRDYQQTCVDDALQAICLGEKRRLYAAPTGTGKSVIELALQSQLQQRGYSAWIVTPRVEIVRGMLDKLGVDTDVSLASLVREATARSITTPTRLVNLLRANRFDDLPDVLIIDEVHHSTSATQEEIRLALQHAQLIGLTATPYRGTPRGTAELIALWGEPQWILRIPEAIERGVMACPTFRVVPLLDDDSISVSAGEFTVSSVSSDTLTRLDAIADLIVKNHGDRPTMASLPSSELVGAMHDKLTALGVASVCVTQKTRDDDRKRAFAACLNSSAVLLQINVVSEGVDLHIRRLIDASPTMSPVRWMQQVGRITRPGGESEYICTNRNMERHGYLWAGAVPPAALKNATTAWGNVSTRSLGSRAIGLEKIGKFRPVELPLVGGTNGAMYGFQTVDSRGRVYEYVAIVHPTAPAPFYAFRERGNAESGYGTWQQIAAIPDLTDATTRSMGSGRLSPKQADWWRRSAHRHGLDSDADVNVKQFQALPVLANCGVRLV